MLADAGFETIHVRDLGMHHGTPDDEILDHALANGLVVVTADTDFPMLIALRRASSPSVVLLRGVNELRPADVGRLLLANLPSVVERLEEGAIVSLNPSSLRWRQLPLR
jgi:predicted nuclease of predicted toxin-antitoxin system